jgi:hypothetical protein
MDFSKYPFEKLFGFAAGVIPGFIALLIFQLAAPGSFGWFFSLGFLGYKTKLSLIILTAFIVGNTMTTFLDSFLGALGGAVGAVVAAQRPYKSPESHPVAPWRDPKWRIALKNYLGAEAPNNTHLISGQLLALKQRQIDVLAKEDRPVALAKLDLEKIESEIDDGNWEQWYAHYHSVVIFDYGKRELHWWVRRGLNFNLETAALYTLMSAFVVPGLRRWWIILPACIWVFILVAEQFASISEVMNKWSSLSRQIQYLMEQEALEKPAT